MDFNGAPHPIKTTEHFADAGELILIFVVSVIAVGFCYSLFQGICSPDFIQNIVYCCLTIDDSNLLLDIVIFSCFVVGRL
jgi:TRAP-type mannitol/chloroaromatic compound transport system permease small subunit